MWRGVKMAFKFKYKLAVVLIGVLWTLYHVSLMKLACIPSMRKPRANTDEPASHVSSGEVNHVSSSMLLPKTKTDGATSRISSDEIKHVAFLKVHKTGSSSVQSIFLRFIDSRNLTMVFPHSTGHPNSTLKCSNVISYNESLTDKNIVPPPPPRRQYDVLCCHVVFDEAKFEKYLPNDTVYIGIVRDPFKRLESAFWFFGLFLKKNASEYAMDPLRYDRDGPSMSNNRMAYEFGFPQDIFPTPEHPVVDRDKVQSYLTKLSKRFDLILINERMEDSLVYMRRLLRWTLEDIIYVRQKIGDQEKRRFTDDDKFKLSSFLHLDIALYNYSVETFDSKFKQLGQDGIDEASFYKDILSKVGRFCQDKTLESIVIAESPWSGPIKITHKKCFLYTWHEQKFIQRLREKTHGTEFN